MSEVPLIVLPPLVGGQAASWKALVELAPSFGDNWLLIGGQLVFLHEIERQVTDVRPTDDVDLVVDLRTEPAGLVNIHAALIAAGFAQDMPGPEGTAHRYRRRGAVMDVLAPDNIGRRAQLSLGVGRTIEAPGTTQAFLRSSTVAVEFDGTTAEIRRPDLVGALLGKAAAAAKIASQSAASRGKHLRDFDSLARLLGPRSGIPPSLGWPRKGLMGPTAIPSSIPSTARTGRYWLDGSVGKHWGSHGLDGCSCLAKVEVAASNPVIRSTKSRILHGFPCGIGAFLGRSSHLVSYPGTTPVTTIRNAGRVAPSQTLVELRS